MALRSVRHRTNTAQGLGWRPCQGMCPMRSVMSLPSSSSSLQLLNGVPLLRVRGGPSEQHCLSQLSFVTASSLCERMKRCWQLPYLSRSMLLELRPSSVGSISLSTVIHVPQACPHSIAPNFHAYSSARIKDLTTMQMDSSERCTSSTASSRAHWLRWMKATMSKYSSRTT